MATDVMADGFPGQGIEAAVFQDSVASSLLPEREQVQEAWERDNPGEVFPGVESLNVDGEQYDPAAEGEPEQAGEPGEALEPATPQELRSYAAGLNEFDRLPQDQQLGQINDMLSAAYESARDGLSRTEAIEFCDRIGPLLGAENLSQKVDPIVFGTFAEAWSNHLETNMRLHPAAPAFMAALQSGDDNQAIQAAAKLCNNAIMLEFFKDHLGAAIGRPEYVANADPLELAAQWIVVGAKAMGWGRQAQPRQGMNMTDDDFVEGARQYHQAHGRL